MAISSTPKEKPDPQDPRQAEAREKVERGDFKLQNPDEAEQLIRKIDASPQGETARRQLDRYVADQLHKNLKDKIENIKKGRGLKQEDVLKMGDYIDVIFQEILARKIEDNPRMLESWSQSFPNATKDLLERKVDTRDIMNFLMISGAIPEYADLVIRVMEKQEPANEQDYKKLMNTVRDVQTETLLLRKEKEEVQEDIADQLQKLRDQIEKK